MAMTSGKSGAEKDAKAREEIDRPWAAIKDPGAPWLVIRTKSFWPCGVGHDPQRTLRGRPTGGT